MCCFFAITGALSANVWFICLHPMYSIFLVYTTLRLLIDYMLVLAGFFCEVRFFIATISNIKADVSWECRYRGVYRWVFINFLILGVLLEFIYIKALV